MTDILKQALDVVFEQLKRYAAAYVAFAGNVQEIASLIHRLGNAVTTYRDNESLMHSEFLAWAVDLDARLRRMEGAMRELKLSEKKLTRFFNLQTLKQLKASLDTDFDQIRKACLDWQIQLQTNAQLKIADKVGSSTPTTVIVNNMVSQMVNNEEASENAVRDLFKDPVAWDVWHARRFYSSSAGVPWNTLKDALVSFSLKALNPPPSIKELQVAIALLKPAIDVDNSDFISTDEFAWATADTPLLELVRKALADARATPNAPAVVAATAAAASAPAPVVVADPSPLKLEQLSDDELAGLLRSDLVELCKASKIAYSKLTKPQMIAALRAAASGVKDESKSSDALAKKNSSPPVAAPAVSATTAAAATTTTTTTPTPSSPSTASTASSSTTKGLSEEAISGSTVAELKLLCDAHNVSYTTKTLKSELQERLRELLTVNASTEQLLVDVGGITALQAKAIVAKRPFADWAAVEKATSAAAVAKLQKSSIKLNK